MSRTASGDRVPDRDDGLVAWRMSWAGQIRFSSLFMQVWVAPLSILGVILVVGVLCANRIGVVEPRSPMTAETIFNWGKVKLLSDPQSPFSVEAILNWGRARPTFSVHPTITFVNSTIEPAAVISSSSIQPSVDLVNSTTEPVVKWSHFSDEDETDKFMLPILRNGTLPCHNIRTQTAQILGLPEEEGSIRLAAGQVHHLLIVSVGEDGKPRCAGGDYYETDLSGPRWKSRPPVVDHNNGTYSVQLQVNPQFVGDYTFEVVLLFSNFHGLKHNPRHFARLEEIATFEIEFVKLEPIAEDPEASLKSASQQHQQMELQRCRLQDFNRKKWSGRWTREKFNDDCEYDRHGRWPCVDSKLECQRPWCEGPVGSLESNGWVYSAHCGFKIFRKEEAWQCLDGMWLFFWGDSNHGDTIRNLLNFVLGFDQKIYNVSRRMDTVFFSPPDNRSSVRITSMFNGHANASMNHQGLFSLNDRAFADQLISYFTGEVAPNFMIMNSGLHDGMYFKDTKRYLKDGVEFAANFWSDVWKNMRARRPDILYRTTVAAGGRGRIMPYNPHKMEVFNQLIVERFLKMNLDRFHIIDGFDSTFPWHWDQKASDGPHYGRPPSRKKWLDDNLGHQYFVDLMLVHMLLNAICASKT